jgi:dihydrodipicolinate synthase/N-acetylneuraminate lyase
MKGIVPPLITPLKERDVLDVDGLERLIERLIKGGVAGVFILGTTGEGPSLSYRLRKEVITHTIKFVARRVPVLVGITDTSFSESVAMGGFAADQGAHSVVAAPPYYFPAGQEELLQYVKDLARALPLEMFIYNMPSLTKTSFDLDTVRAAQQCERVIGVKDSSCDMIYFHKMLAVAKERADWSVFIGPEELTAEAVLLGADGGVNGGANLNPSLYVDLYQAAAARDLPRVCELHVKVMDLAGRIYTVGKHKSAIIKGLKCALSLLDICDDSMAEPFHPFNQQDRERVRAHLVELGMLQTS